MKYAVDMTSGGIIYIPRFVKDSINIYQYSDFTSKFSRLQRWYYCREELTKYAVETVSGGMMCLPSFMKSGSGIQIIILLLSQQFETLQCLY
jgi:hypothetical protein